MKAETLQFGDFRLDCSNYELSRRGHPLPVERKPMELLILLATRPGQLVTRAEIAAALWGSDVFVETHSGINTAIRKIRHILRDDSDEPRFIQTVMGRGYRFIGQIEPVPAPVEIPPVSAPVDSPPTSTTRLVAGHLRSRALLLGLIVCSAAVALLTVLHQRSTHSPTRIHSLAVLPLENLSGDPQQEYLADGMTDELITMLVRDSTLPIVPRSSVMQFKGAHRPPAEVARALHVDGLIDGSITRSGDNVHVTAQLIGIPNDTLLWAQSYDRSVGESVRLPSEIALTVARRLQSVAAQPAAPPVVNAAAHDAYLRGMYIWYSGGDEAERYFRKAIELEPDYAPGWSGLAAYFGAATMGGKLDPRLSVPQQRAAALKAVQLDDSLAEAHLSLAGAYMCDLNIQSALSETDRAIQLKPSFANAYHLRARLELALNRNAEAIEAQRTAMELDPFERPWAMAWVLLSARQYDATIQEAQFQLETLPNNGALYWMLGEAYDRKGDDDKAAQALEKSESLKGHNSLAATMRAAYQRGGRTALVKAELTGDERQSASSYVSPANLARFHAQLGEREQALSLLNEAYRQRCPQLLWIQTDPAFDFLHQDARYQSLIRQLGLPPSY
ncbi:MAG TPA: winged helix-turn-helix domain-containing protein [Silvibacterium sp.]|jgi:TolB-like protein/DNA-binding winged helix-turn-helix (wHTH) protein/cytochrome c-type biogenesis protein CcmH/NrfG|nr:winged helix-turn-helix domain-containing protein [Silvibacterium sp.]